MMLRFRIGPSGPDEEVIAAISELIRRSEVVILPTDTLYGLHCSADDARAIETIFQIKERERGKPLLVLASGIDQIRAFGGVVSEVVAATLSQIWPAPLTAIIPLRSPIAASADSGTIAVRVPGVSWLRTLAERCGPITSTSVNVSGEPPVNDMDRLPASAVSRVAAVVDAGPLRGSASTLVDFTTDPPQVLRQGAAEFSQDLWKTSRKSL